MLATAAKTERERNQFAQNLIDDHEEQARKHHQHQHQSGGDERLASRRPDDLGGLGAHLLDELERIGHCWSIRTSRRKRPAAPGLKNSRRGASRRRATSASYRKAWPLAKRNVTFRGQSVHHGSS